MVTRIYKLGGPGKNMAKGFSKGGTIHRTKASAEKVAKSCRISGVKYRIVKLKGGYRVDKKY